MLQESRAASHTNIKASHTAVAVMVGAPYSHGAVQIRMGAGMGIVMLDVRWKYHLDARSHMEAVLVVQAVGSHLSMEA